VGLAALAGCQSLPSSERLLGIVTPYRIEVVQGNVVTREQIALVKPGMSRAQVRDVLGSPLLTDPFHADRWDYVFTLKRPGAASQARALMVLFDGEVLKSIEGGSELPTEREFVDAIDTQKPPRNPPVLALTEEQRKALPAAARIPSPTAAAEGVTRTYPPLESPAP
jgi:outer membrane protein assembly factor BamE